MEEVLNNIKDTTYTKNSPIAGANVVEWKPRIGMKFETEEEAYDFYTENSPKAETRTGCLARMLIQVSKYTYKFEVTKFVESHNHPLMIDEYMHMLPSQRRISRVQAIDLELASDSGISPRNSYELMGRQVGGKESVGYMKLDMLNHIRTRRQTELEYGEAAWLMNYFETQSCEDPFFFYAFQLDNDQMITNIFWADSKMIVDYCNFGDVISFDTTYKVVHGNHPFGSFLGLNHHQETTVFGAAFMYDETAESFVWLFEIFLKAMSGKAPKMIFTDQDAVGKGIDADFFTHFERLLSDKCYKEYVAEYGLLHNLPQLKTNCTILVEAANLYTKFIFNSFQEKFLAAGAS
ncbi:protein FAR1-RELATED SEQUENCE 5-like [Cornus florida]|uniref:protein FAR1-RELATED SEQUENCE 5-like n=1 Tax=Cornus florida TaxID=4283 RepID=UPI002898B114|nr:protein FAR1-RELATED SEQUENCE 5-like [Cornus florida]